jgi:ADP-ribose pyrophosphatase YjhB (NUDIX family)
MKIVRESILNEKKDKLDLSAGLVVIQDNKILLIHPKNAPWKNSFSIPKGHVEQGEELIDAAIRETSEETGIDATKLIIEDPTPKFVDYTTKKGDVYKRVYYFIAHPAQPIEKKHLKPQKEEADWAGFLSAKEAKDKIFWRFKDLLKYLPK